MTRHRIRQGRLPAIMALFVLGGCVVTARDLDRRYGMVAPRPESLKVCRHYGCADVVATGLDAADWAAVRAWFEPAPADAAAERRAVAEAVGEIERRIGPKIGTQADPPGSKFYTPDSTGEQDCLDEAVNTTNYLRLMAATGLLRFHGVGPAAYRGYVIDGAGPHNTATLTETATGARFAVDSFFHGNGNPAETVDLQRWKKRWHPARILPPRGLPAASEGHE